jgi:hypothetical protein
MNIEKASIKDVKKINSSYVNLTLVDAPEQHPKSGA